MRTTSAEIEARQLLLFPTDGRTEVSCRPRYWLTPPELLAAFDAEFGFDFDPCPNPLPSGFNGLEVSWGTVNYVNPPYRPVDSLDGRAAPDFIRKAIVEQAKGKTSVFALSIHWNTHLLLNAGAEVRPLGRISWRDVATGDPEPKARPAALFILRGDPADALKRS